MHDAYVKSTQRWHLTEPGAVCLCPHTPPPPLHAPLHFARPNHGLSRLSAWVIALPVCHLEQYVCEREWVCVCVCELAAVMRYFDSYCLACRRIVCCCRPIVRDIQDVFENIQCRQSAQSDSERERGREREGKCSLVRYVNLRLWVFSFLCVCVSVCLCLYLCVCVFVCDLLLVTCQCQVVKQVCAQ